MRFRSIIRLLAQALAAASGGAQASTAISPVRPLGPIIATSKDMLGAVAQIRVLSDGRVLANDSHDKRVVLFDSSLAHFTLVIDTTSETARAYGARGGALFSFTGDTSLFGDVVSLSMLVIDPAGRLARVVAAPRGLGGGLVYMLIPGFGATIDGHGHMVSQWN
ncbi:MAG TPA: hypothetical protein VMH39_01665, partial [Gemmatimonadaceae bacterium]|nr:hypothetical protein [Gemmatimonadaceae bacterium]